MQTERALFYNTIKGEQLTIQEAPTLNPSLTNTFNSPKDKKVKGVEVELFWAALDGLGSAATSRTWTRTSYDEYDNPYTS